MDDLQTLFIRIAAFDTEKMIFLGGVVASCLFVIITWLASKGSNASLAESAKSLLANSAFYVINLMFGPLATLCTDLIRRGMDGLHLPHLETEFWSGIPLPVLVLIGILTYDLANYWCHRAMHAWSWLWPVHAIHHSDPDVNGLTTYRVHFLEAIIMLVPFAVLMAILREDPEAVLLAGFFIGIHNIYVHFNVDWGHGPLRYVIASPRYHRWHHADVPEAHGMNLANVFPFLDVLFRTYYVPGRCDERMGAEGVPQNDVVKLFLFPFAEWGRMLKSGIESAVDRMRTPHGRP